MLNMILMNFLKLLEAYPVIIHHWKIKIIHWEIVNLWFHFE